MGATSRVARQISAARARRSPEPRWTAGAHALDFCWILSGRAPGTGLKLYYELAISTRPRTLASVLQISAPDHLLFGSDFPALFEDDIQSLIQALAHSPLLQPGHLEMIQRRNALQLFPRLLRPSAAAG